MATVAVVVIDPRTGNYAMSAAGAEPTFVIGADMTVNQLAVHGMLVGVRTGAAYKEAHGTLQLSESLLMFTDGITEARSGGHFFGLEGVQRVLESGSAHTIHALGEEIMQASEAFAGGKRHDDACIIIARRTYA